MKIWVSYEKLRKEDKFEKFMDKLMSQAISKVVMSFSSSLKAY